MNVSLIDRVSLTLDETRLLMLGAAVLLGFQFQVFFLEGFPALPHLVQVLQLASLLCLLLTIVLVIGPTMFDMIVFHGHVSRTTQRYANPAVEAAMLPFAGGIFLAFLGCSWSAVGAGAACVLAGIGFLATSGLWFAYPRWRRARLGRPALSFRIPPMQKPQPTPLSIRMRDILTEARIILPGAQAMLGFQMVIFFSKAFQALPDFLRLLHLASACLMLVSIVLLMSPPAYHRIVEDGEETERLYMFSRRVVLAATVPFALSMACDLRMVAGMVLAGAAFPLGLAAAAVAVCAACWFGYPFLVRRRFERREEKKGG